MALTSPRFRSSHTLNKVAMNAATLHSGSVGRTVHLVQMALLDLGYAMPNSTGNDSGGYLLELAEQEGRDRGRGTV